MAKPCCEPTDRKPTASLGVWLKRGFYAVVIALVLFTMWSQFMSTPK